MPIGWIITFLLVTGCFWECVWGRTPFIMGKALGWHHILSNYLTIGLWVISQAKIELHAQSMLERCPQWQSEHKISTWNNLTRNILMQSNNIFQENMCYRRSCVGCPHGWRMSYLGQLIHCHHNLIMSLWWHRKPCYKINKYCIHFHLVMVCGYKGPVRCWCSMFTLWHSRHWATKSATSWHIPTQK